MDDPTAKVMEVEWEDSQTQHGWTKAKIELPARGGYRSVGYVLQDDESGVILLESWDAAEAPDHIGVSRFGCQTAIPRSAIRKVRYLRGRR